MAATDANVFPAKNAAFRLAVTFRDNTGALITGWAGAASSISVDGAAASAGSAPVEIGTTGLGYLDLTAAQMNGELIMVKCTVTNASALAFAQAIYTGGLAEIVAAVPTAAPTAADNAAAVWGATRTQATTLTPTTYGPILDLVMKMFLNRLVKSGNTVTVYNDTNTSMGTQSYSVTDTGFDRSKGS